MEALVGFIFIVGFILTYGAITIGLAYLSKNVYFVYTTLREFYRFNQNDDVVDIAIEIASVPLAIFFILVAIYILSLLIGTIILG